MIYIAVRTLFVYPTTESNNDLTISIYTILFRICFCLLMLMLILRLRIHNDLEEMWETTLVRLFCTPIHLQRMETGRHVSYHTFAHIYSQHLVNLSNEKGNTYFLEGNAICASPVLQAYTWSLVFMHRNESFFSYLGCHAKCYSFTWEEKKTKRHFRTIMKPTCWRLFLLKLILLEIVRPKLGKVPRSMRLYQNFLESKIEAKRNH